MKTAGTIIGTILISAILFLTFVPSGRAAWNNYTHGMQKVDDATLYKTRKKVENEARAMVASYKADKLKYEQYKASSDKHQQEWGEQAKMRANQTASIYNNYILTNSYVFDGNIPPDINYQLELIP